MRSPPICSPTREKRDAMGEALRRMAVPDASEQIYKTLLALTRK